MTQSQTPPLSGTRGKTKREIEDIILDRPGDVKGQFVFEAEADAGGRIVEDGAGLYLCELCGHHYPAADMVIAANGCRLCRTCEEIWVKEEKNGD